MTTATVPNSRVPSMPSNAAAWSAPMPAGPVTWVAIPSLPVAAVARMPSTAGLRSFQPLLPMSTGTTVCRARPSSDSWGPTTAPSTCGAVANVPASWAALARSASVMPLARW